MLFAFHLSFSFPMFGGEEDEIDPTDWRETESMVMVMVSGDASLDFF